ncbi:MAG: arsenate reductase ArsC, partial [Bacteroidales bacterium]|nr:arsenate reductase ArsC [Bacteroidales bacterium]
GNSCRSKMAEGFFKSFDSKIEVFSAGTNPSDKIHPKAIVVMHEIGIDISNTKPQNVDTFVNQNFDYVITVCDNAKETCPVFIGNVKNRLHIGFEDPAEAKGTEEEIYRVFRKVRDEILHDFKNFYIKNINQ